MLTALWSAVGTHVGERWASLIASPALAFWFGGLLAWTWGHGGWFGAASGWSRLDELYLREIGDANTVLQIAGLAVLLVGVAVSAAIAQTLSLSVLRLLEGYWRGPFRVLRRWRVRRRAGRIDRTATAWRDLALRPPESLSPEESAQFRHLTVLRSRVPSQAGDRMPTALGDLLRAAELRPFNWYGLDTVTCFPRLWLVLPEPSRVDLAAARARLDRLAGLWFWSVLFTAWVGLAWWAPIIAAAGSLTAYLLLLSAAGAYGELLQACYDIHRGALYEALGVTRPADPVAERRIGLTITAGLQGGPDL